MCLSSGAVESSKKHWQLAITNDEPSMLGERLSPLGQLVQARINGQEDEDNEDEDDAAAVDDDDNDDCAEVSQQIRVGFTFDFASPSRQSFRARAEHTRRFLSFCFQEWQFDLEERVVSSKVVLQW